MQILRFPRTLPKPYTLSPCGQKQTILALSAQKTESKILDQHRHVASMLVDAAQPVLAHGCLGPHLMLSEKPARRSRWCSHVSKQRHSHSLSSASTFSRVWVLLSQIWFTCGLYRPNRVHVAIILQGNGKENGNYYIIWDCLYTDISSTLPRVAPACTSS